MAEPDIDEVRRELAALAEQLERLPDGAFAERIDVRERQRELREIVRRHVIAGDMMSADQLKRQIALVENQIRDHYGNRLTTRSGPQTGLGGGIDPTIVHEMNRKMDKLADLDGLKARLRSLKDRLAAHENEAP